MSLHKKNSKFHIKYNINTLFVNINDLKNCTLHTIHQLQQIQIIV